MSDTGAAKLPGIPEFRTSDRALAAWAQAVTEHLEVRAGVRGNPAERAALQRDITDIRSTLAKLQAAVDKLSPGQ